MKIVMAVIGSGLLLVGCGQGSAIATKTDENSPETATQAKTEEPAPQSRANELTDEVEKKKMGITAPMPEPRANPQPRANEAKKKKFSETFSETPKPKARQKRGMPMRNTTLG